MKKSLKVMTIIDKLLHLLPAAFSIIAFFYYKAHYDEAPFLSELMVLIFASVAPVVILAGKRLQKLHDAIIAGAGFVLFAQLLCEIVTHPYDTTMVINCSVAASICLIVAILYLLATYGFATCKYAHLFLYVGAGFGMFLVVKYASPEILAIFAQLILNSTLKPVFAGNESEEGQNEKEE